VYHHRVNHLRLVLAASFAASLAILVGCSRVSNSLDTVSMRSGSVLRTEAGTRVFSATDRNTADFYLTDLPASAAEPGADLSKLSGTLVHVHLFLSPRPGETPIADEACSFTVRQAVFANGQFGVYSGGGFFTPARDLGDKTNGGRFRGATLRLTHSTPGFEDKLGPSEMAGSFRAGRDDVSSAAWASLLARTIGSAPPRSAKP
jgi:hypothetical protein